MSKRMFQILDEMNLSDIENNTGMVSISNALVSSEKCKQGGLITIGVDEKTLIDIISEDRAAVLVVVDIKEYNKRK